MVILKVKSFIDHRFNQCKNCHEVGNSVQPLLVLLLTSIRLTYSWQKSKSNSLDFPVLFNFTSFHLNGKIYIT